MEKIFTGETREGVFSYAAVSTLPYFGWSVALIVPATQVNGLLWRSLASIIVAAVLCCIAGVWLASWFARRLAEPVKALSAAAKALGEGRLDQTPPTLALAELNEVSQDLQRAAELLREQSRTRDRIEAALRERDNYLEQQAQLLRNSEEVLRRQAGELEQQLLASGRLVAVGELTASMAHEFNNPLGIILGFAQGLLAEMDPADANFHHIQIIAEEARRCEKLVQELLEFGRPRKAEFTQVDIKSVVEKTLDLVSNRAANSHIGTSVSISDDLPAVRADMQQIQQLLLNLSLNAIDAMPQGGHLTLTADKNGATGVTLTIADTGSGIGSETLRRIFQPFYTANKRRGLGLGLPICDRIVKAHGGSISVESQPNVGTTFKVHLPINGNGSSAPGADAID
jgi:signal transduction histidine kinase